MPDKELLPQALGYFSLALGSAQVLAPEAVARVIRVPRGPTTTKVMRGLGLGALAAGVAAITRGGERAEAVPDQAHVTRAVTIRRSIGEVYGYARDFRNIGWDAEILEEESDQFIRWRTNDDRSGTLRFKPAPGDRGTEVHLEMDYMPSGGAAGSLVGRLLRKEPSQQVQADLRDLKRMLETGEVIRSTATLDGTGLLQQRPAQPQGVGI